MDKVHMDNLIPLTVQQMLKFNGLLGTNPPAIATSGTERHIVQKFSLVFLVLVGQSARRAVLNTGKASVALIIHLKMRHL
jgi:hypothetical protein